MSITTIYPTFHKILIATERQEALENAHFQGLLEDEGQPEIEWGNYCHPYDIDCPIGHDCKNCPFDNEYGLEDTTYSDWLEEQIDKD